MNRDVFSGAALLFVSLGYFWATRSLPPGRDEPGPAFFPILLSGALALLATVILIRAWHAAKDEPPPRSWLLVGMTFLFPLAFATVGYAIATFVYSGSMALLLGRRRLHRIRHRRPPRPPPYMRLFSLFLGVPLP